jgi:hypothetical protein
LQSVPKLNAVPGVDGFLQRLGVRLKIQFAGRFSPQITLESAFGNGVTRA